jgi:glucose/arabinose dehydrogenase
MPRSPAAIFALIFAMAAPALAQVDQGRPNVPEFSPAFENQTRAPELRDMPALNVEVVTRSLDNAWGIEVLPDGRYLVTERPGGIKLVGRDGAIEEVRGAPKVREGGQGGLLDVALAPDFASSGRIYLTYSKAMGSRRAGTAVATAVLEDRPARLTGLTDIYVPPRGSRSGRHFGSRVVPTASHLYVTIGDRGEMDRVQHLGSSNGKVLRLTLNGDVPGNNPFRSTTNALPEIYSYGHRNPQGADIHPGTGELWTIEHGPAGGDELNRVEAGTNYGWPVISYGEDYGGGTIGRGLTQGDGMAQPVYYWDPVIAPGGFAFYDGELFNWQGDVIASSLNPGGIVRLKLNGDRVVGEGRFLGDLGRVRDIEIDRDGAIIALAGGGGIFRITPK